ncbi:GIY-YIG nuclease family protein [Neorhodopirellula pilleata]|uniref:UvrABC system protein C n=1 Tax=Neorhodopirellula pilleata TaxID=2714738 RepID=A0A5C6AWA5_9BACT|nr:GIY-YIG nuclease family protein [Neorhodopirellula pilleata]TWU03356.1 UvrABC system protein C [Neorhodopirellula pilleata]
MIKRTRSRKAPPPEAPLFARLADSDGAVGEATPGYRIGSNAVLTVRPAGAKSTKRIKKVNPCAGGGFGANPFDPYQTSVDVDRVAGTPASNTARPSEIVGGVRRRELHDQVNSLCPPVPGVYGMFDRTGELIYVGKSRSLRHRLMSYFSDSSQREKAGRIIEHTRAIQWETQPSDFAAQLRELDLIRRWTPRFNVQGVPQRQRPVYLCLGRKPAETFFVASSPPTTDCVAVEGPFYGVARMSRVVDALNKTFRLRDCSQKTVFQYSEQMSLFDLQPRPGCLRLEIGTCLGPCAAACTRAEYLERVNAAQSFIDGFNDEPLIATQETMQLASANQQYELAGRARDTLKSLNYALRKLTHLADARQTYSFVYAAKGYDGRSIWYLIRRGEVVDVAAAPTGPQDYRELKPLLQIWGGQLGPRQTTFASEHPHTISVVASWFRKHRQELKQTFAPDSAGRKYRHLSRVASSE